MINLATYTKLQCAIFDEVKYLEQLKVLREQIIAFQDLIFDSDTRNLIGYAADNDIDNLQTPLENLTMEIDWRIKKSQSNVDGWNNELRHKIFFDAE